MYHQRTAQIRKIQDQPTAKDNCKTKSKTQCFLLKSNFDILRKTHHTSTSYFYFYDLLCLLTSTLLLLLLHLLATFYLLFTTTSLLPDLLSTTAIYLHLPTSSRRRRRNVPTSSFATAWLRAPTLGPSPAEQRP